MNQFGSILSGFTISNFFSKPDCIHTPLIFIVFLISLSSSAQPLQILAENSSWLFYYQEFPPPADWKNPGFNDFSWSQSNAVLG
jgi:hypothetical protein